MAANTTVGSNGAVYAGNFIMEKNQPLDDRLVVATKDKLLQYNNYVYAGMPVVVLEDNTLWVLKDTAKKSTADYSGWTCVGTADIIGPDGKIPAEYLPSFVDSVLEGYYVEEDKWWADFTLGGNEYCVCRAPEYDGDYKLNPTDEEDTHMYAYEICFDMIRRYRFVYATDDLSAEGAVIGDTQLYYLKQDNTLGLWGKAVNMSEHTTTGTFYRTRTIDTEAETLTYIYSEPYMHRTGKIYVDLETEIEYRWGGTIYVQITEMDVISNEEIDSICTWTPVVV